MSKIKLIFVAALALGAITLASGSATAASFRIEPQGNIRTVSLGKLTFEGGVAIECNITMNGSLSSALLNKVEGTEFGRITEVRFALCEGGNVETIRNLPWPMTYKSILGTLPSAVTGMVLVVNGADFKLSAFGGFARCRYRGNAEALMEVSGSNPYTAGLIRSLENPLSLVEGALCPATGTMKGSFTLTPTTRITRL